MNHNWDSIVSDIKEFYYVLKKINKRNIYSGLDDEINILLSISTFYLNLEFKFRNDQYKGLNEIGTRLFNQVNIIFEICEFWDDVEAIIKSEKDEINPLFKQYFMLEMHSFKDNAFLHISNLKQALEALMEFYELKDESYESNFSLLLLRIIHKVQLVYESESGWFEHREKEINKLLKEIAEKVYSLDKVRDEYAQDVIDKIKIYVFKFNQNCESDTLLLTA